MKLDEIIEILEGEMLCCEEEGHSLDIMYAYGADLMSDVLAFANPGSLLITGLTNIQIVRTAQMMDLPAIIFVRGKRPQDATLELAKRVGIPIMLVKKSMYEICGLLYKAGVVPCEIKGLGGQNCGGTL